MTTKPEANPVLTAIRMNKGLAARIGDECHINRCLEQRGTILGETPKNTVRSLR